MKKLQISTIRHKVTFNCTKVIELFVVLSLFLSIPQVALGSTWAGVDETVVERYAEEMGRPAKTPLINTDQGDLLLFVFLLAGVAGGFIMGYYWRILFKDKRQVGQRHASAGESLVRQGIDDDADMLGERRK